ncbi:MAG: radical SAM protein, partial [Flavobacteriales bacterium]|nr:radical SAM protein [Flavobacteriales bacterium]
LLLIPPLTQLNTPYPATAYLTGFLRQQGIAVRQGDLGLDLVLEVFSRKGLKALFDEIEKGNFQLNHSLANVLANRAAYESTIEPVISYLQNSNYTLGYRIASREYLPEGNRFKALDELSKFFGNNGVQDKARYLSTMYLEDISDLIQATVGPHFGFSKYAERIARTAVSFQPLHKALEDENNYLDAVLCRVVSRYFETSTPTLVGFTVPFPGNLYGALKAGQWIKKHYPATHIVLGGGYVNTELRELRDPAVFNYVDYISLDDGERPLLALIESLRDPTKKPALKRTYVRTEDQVQLVSNELAHDFSQAQLPAPSYEGLRLKEYLSMFDMPNPMHRLWNDGRWNKMTIAHGCYWKKCSFCDVSLDYIARFDESPAKLLVDKMEQLIAETGETGFHFVDEAAPPLAMRDLALEILSRGLQVSWWTNIRFEKTFSEDLCKLLAASGCIAVTGGLEVASDRLLAMMEKGITIEQVARVCKGFRDAGILVHAYLMYGFPTETEQETIDSLEVVRQLFQNNLLQSAFWHQFAMTVHSPVGIHPEKYQVIRTGPTFEGFANNDLFHDDPTGAAHEKYADGLKKALYNYMHGLGFDWPLQQFFSFLIAHPTVPSKLISKHIKRHIPDNPNLPGLCMMWHRVRVKLLTTSNQQTEVLFIGVRSTVKLQMPAAVAQFIHDHAAQFEVEATRHLLLKEVVSQLAEMLAMDEAQIVLQEWWRLWRKDVVWVIKT